MQDTTTVNIRKRTACSVMLQPYVRWRIIPAISKVYREIIFIRVTVLVVNFKHLNTSKNNRLLSIAIDR